MFSRNILWVDDEIDLLTAHIRYLEDRGFTITPVTNGFDALELVKNGKFDLVLVDEIMPVMGGLEFIGELKRVKPDLPTVMVTKNEAEELMEQAIGRQVDAFLTKPVNPSQVLSVLKSILERRQISAGELARRWAQDFSLLSQLTDQADSPEEWYELHYRLCQWELDLDQWSEKELLNNVRNLRLEADRRFGRWVEERYPEWVQTLPPARTLLSPDIADHFLIPLWREPEQFPHPPLNLPIERPFSGPVLFLVIDCLRLDQWLALESLVKEFFDLYRSWYFSILPTATPYARNSIFSGMFPSELEKLHPDLWDKGDEDEASSNRWERQLLQKLLSRRGIDLKSEVRYLKILHTEEAGEFERRVNDYLQIPLTAVVYNFVDILVHTRQSTEVIKEMLPDESAFRSVTRAWFPHSSLFRILQAYGRARGVVVITSDHGSLKVRKAISVVGDRQTSTSLRYKFGRNLKVDDKVALRIKDPRRWGLPARGINTEYIIAREDHFFLYPNNFHYYERLFQGSFQHGGISMEEMILPVVVMVGKGV